jgi:succinate-semialdehyde dehydrogenase/glutarate-semialdehyde dehydrogenase
MYGRKVTITTIDPSTGNSLATYEETPPEEIDAILDRAHRAAAEWRLVSPDARAKAVRGLAELLRDQRDELALLATTEMGKPITESQAEVDTCVWALEWFGDHAPELLDPETVDTGAVRSRVIYVPLGVVFAVMPWNFPYWQVIRALAPAVTAGNVLLLKHAPSTTGCALRINELAGAAGWPDGVLSLVLAGFDTTPAVSERIIADDRVAAVTLTGSTGAGRSVAALAGRALKKTVLELGGSDPFIVLADADLEAAATFAVRSRFQNTGQSCIAAKRVIVEERVADAFTEIFLDKVADLRVGDPADPQTTVGPLARADLRDALARQVTRSVEQGARILTGGRPADRPGFYYEPTVLDGVTADMPVLREEVFGPAAPLVRVADADAAVERANDTRYGLGSNLWTSDLDRGEALAARSNAGHTAVNGMTASDPRLPFGGIKESGYGRELSRHGLLEFVNIHSVVVNHPGGPGTAPAPSE